MPLSRVDRLVVARRREGTARSPPSSGRPRWPRRPAGGRAARSRPAPGARCRSPWPSSPPTRPCVRPVVYSAIAGATGARSAGRSLPKAPSFCGRVLARLASMKVCAALRENWMGTLDSDSAPPAEDHVRLAGEDRAGAEGDGARRGGAGEVHRHPRDAHRQRGAEDHLAPEVRGVQRRHHARRRPRGRSRRDRSPVRATSSEAATLARSITSMLGKSVPDLTNGVRQPSTIATRPWAPLSALGARRPGP